MLRHKYAHLARRDVWSNLIAHLLGAARALHAR
jgi:beta-lactamase regulating signal transducer with metallopeptidase domain